MSDSIENARSPRLSIDPVTGDLQPERINTPAEKIERVINPEDEILPGNTGWTGSIKDAGAKKWDDVKLWSTTLVDRFASTTGATRAESARTYESSLSKRANQFSQREARHSQELAKLEARTGLWNLPVARSITAVQARYHSWRQRTNEHKASRADARAEKFSKKAATAEKYQQYFDGKVAMRVQKVTERWQQKADRVAPARERIDARISELGEAISKHEALISKVRARVSVLENARGGDRSTRREQLKGLYKMLSAEEAALDNERKMMGRAQKNRIRLAAAHDSAESVIASFKSSFENHEAWKNPDESPPESTVTPADATTTDNADSDVSWSLKELLDGMGNITNEQVGKLWNEVFKNAKLPGGHKTLISYMKATFPDREISDAPGDSMPIKSLLSGLRALYDASADFQKLTQQATGLKKKKAIDTLVGRLETRLAFTGNLNDL